MHQEARSPAAAEHCYLTVQLQLPLVPRHTELVELEDRAVSEHKVGLRWHICNSASRLCTSNAWHLPVRRTGHMLGKR
jgi:hypothetical protein